MDTHQAILKPLNLLPMCILRPGDLGTNWEGGCGYVCSSKSGLTMQRPLYILHTKMKFHMSVFYQDAKDWYADTRLY